MIDFSQLSNAVLERLAVEPDIIVKNHIYIFTKTFDVYICWLGRITVAEKLCVNVQILEVCIFSIRRIPYQIALRPCQERTLRNICSILQISIII